RKFGKSKYGFNKFFHGIFDMLTLLFLKRYLKSPLHFFGMIGFSAIILGIGVLGYFGVEWIVTQQMRIRPLTLLSLGSIIVGIQFLSFGFLAEMMTHQFRNDEYKIRNRINCE
ncbi:MAG TPA: hypothetical protein VKO63_01290, partial [Chitinispirillaceae bacterium]|nr:hypothetical protein [Chitinispirillaceae bacterium]